MITLSKAVDHLNELEDQYKALMRDKQFIDLKLAFIKEKAKKYAELANNERQKQWEEKDIEAYGFYMIDTGWSQTYPECKVFKGLTSLGREVYNVSKNRLVADKVIYNVFTGDTSIYKDNKELVFKGITANQRELNLAVFQTLHKNRKW